MTFMWRISNYWDAFGLPSYFRTQFYNTAESIYLNLDANRTRVARLSAPYNPPTLAHALFSIDITGWKQTMGYQFQGNINPRILKSLNSVHFYINARCYWPILRTSKWHAWPIPPSRDLLAQLMTDDKASCMSGLVVTWMTSIQPAKQSLQPLGERQREEGEKEKRPCRWELKERSGFRWGRRVVACYKRMWDAWGGGVGWVGGRQIWSLYVCTRSVVIHRMYKQVYVHIHTSCMHGIYMKHFDISWRRIGCLIYS